MFDLEKIFEQWVLATDEDITSNTIKIGLEHSWYVRTARDCLKEDPTGLMSVLKLREAFKAFVKNHHFTIQDLLLGAWETRKGDLLQLQQMLFSGDVQQLYDNFISLVTNTTKLLGKEISSDELNNISNIESIIFDSIKNFNAPYKLKHEKFTNANPRPHNNAKVIPILYRFDYLQQFVDSLRQTSEDNFMCLALIERTYDRTDSDYDKKYDTFFAFGIKNNGAVYIVSDRTIFQSPETYFKTRNPGREYNNKVDYSWFPYYKMEEIKSTISTNQMLLLPDPKAQNVPKDSLVNVFDSEGLVYISILFTLIYKKYFIDLYELVETKSWFSTEVKFLPPTTSTALIPSETQLQVVEPKLSIEATTWEYTDKIYNSGLFDFYIKEYPLPENDTNKLIDYIGTEDEFKKLSWWRMRKMQYEHIIASLNQNWREKELACETWLKEQFHKNKEQILKYMLTNKPICLYDKFTVNPLNAEECTKPMLWELYRDGKEMDTVEISHSKHKHNQCEYTQKDQYRHSQCIQHFLVDNERLSVFSGYRYPRFDCWFDDDSQVRPIAIALTLRSYSDFEKFFGVSNDQLPKELKRHFYDRINMYSCYGWKPYDGNCILDFVDPMNDLKDPYNKIEFMVVLYLSKSRYNKLKKQLNIVDTKEDALDD